MEKHSIAFSNEYKVIFVSISFVFDFCQFYHGLLGRGFTSFLGNAVSIEYAPMSVNKSTLDISSMDMYLWVTLDHAEDKYTL